MLDSGSVLRFGRNDEWPENGLSKRHFHNERINREENNNQMNIHLSIQNQRGSVQHYYHFLLGFFVPLVLARNELVSRGDVEHILVRSCAILDSHVHGLGFPELQILERSQHAAIRDSGRYADTNTPLYFTSVAGYDQPGCYENIDFQHFSDTLRGLFCQEMTAARAEVEAQFGHKGPKIVLIGRERPHAFYSTPLSEGKTAGSQRRSIPNLNEIKEDLNRHGFNLLLEFLEGKNLWQQMALFECADVVIAQHGAALANLIFGRCALRVIEILPHDQPGILEADIFGKLARRMGQDYEYVRQDTAHAKVEPADIRDLLYRAL